MSVSSGRTIAVTHRLLVALQIFVIAASLVAPAAVLASDPSADPSADPTPTTEPTPTAEPTPEPTAEPTAAPTAGPTEAPEETPAPATDPTPDPTDEPSAEPTPAPTPEATPSATPTIASDLEDYPPGGLVTLSGSGWTPGESVHIFVNDDWGSSWSRNVDVVADSTGSIGDQFSLPNWFVAQYSVIATGSSGTSAATTFTDSNPSALSVGAPTSVSVPQGTTASYGTLTVQATGNSGACNTTLSVISGTGTGLPAGASPVFGANPVTTNGANKTTAFSVSTLASTPTGTYTFQVSGVDSEPPGGSCQGGATNSPSALLTLIVTTGTVTTTTTVTSNNDPSTFGQSVTFTATVTATGGNPSGVGTVSFTDDGTALCTNVPLVTNQATCTTSALGAKATPHDIVATYSGTTSGSPQFGSSTSAAFEQDVNKASSTTTVDCPVSIVYTGAALTPCTVSVTGAGGLDLTPDPTYTDNTNVGTATASYTYTGDTNYTGSSGSDNFEILPAPSTTTIDCPVSIVYTGAALTPCTVSVTGAGGLDLTPDPTYTDNTNVGTATASYTYTGDTNHTGSSGSDNFEILPAPSTTTVDCPVSVVYDGTAQEPCTANVTGAGGLDVGLTVDYADNINAGTATASAAYAGDANHTGSDDSTTFEIEQAPSETVVTCPASVMYDGTAQEPCTANVTGAGGLDVGLTVDYADNINAGTATASAAYAGDANHTGSDDSTTFEIEQAPSETVVTCPASVMYDGSAQEPCTASVTGAGGLDVGLTVDYADNINAGTATASAAYAGDANHTGSDDSTTFEIEQAPSETVVTCPASVMYDGSAQEPCTASVTGAGGLDVGLTVDYADNINAGTATASAAYAGDANHTGSDDSTTFEIEQAPSETVVTCPASVMYDGSAQEPCTASVTGAGGLDEPVAVTYADNTNAGTATASATFTGDANHTGSDDSTTFEILPAPSTTVVTCPVSVVYTGSLLTPCTVTVTGAGGLDLSPAPTYTSNLLVGTASASYTYGGDANHTGSADAETFQITTAFRIIGFDSPVDMTPIGHERYYNSVKNGQTVPLKFRVYNLDGTEVVSPTGLSALSRSVSCVSGDIDPTLLPIDSTADTGLRRTGDRFHFNWAVPKGAGKCYQILVRTVDGSTTMVGSLAGTPVHEAYFRSK